MVIRNLLRIVDYQPALYLVGGLCVGLTRGSQRLGDLAVGTTVIQDANATTPGATRTSSRRARRIFAWSLAAAVVFTIGFDYFGRPPLVIESDFNQHRFVLTDVNSYSLGTPTWAVGTVTYPVRASSPTSTCTGTIQLRWEFPFGWIEDSGTLDCPPS